MKRTRSSTTTFNPEKFLAQEKKNELTTLPSIGELLPIAFSKERRRAFIAKLSIKSPAVFFRGQDSASIQTAIATLKDEIARELALIGVASDRTLIGFLLADVIRDPAWRRAARRKPNA